jgi:hypothetical protein
MPHQTGLRTRGESGKVPSLAALEAQSSTNSRRSPEALRREKGRIEQRTPHFVGLLLSGWFDAA